jgi:hypothetical protein
MGIFGIGVLFLTFNCAGSSVVPPGAGAGDGSVQTVNFPEWMEAPDTSMSAGTYQLRKAARTDATEFLFSLAPEVYDPEPDKEWYDLPAEQSGDVRSLNYYTVNASAGFKVSPATAQDWGQAEKVLHSRHQIIANSGQLPGEPPAHTDDEVKFNGKAYKKTGDFWGSTVACAAAGGKRLAVFSFDTPDKSRKDAKSNFFLFLGGGGPSRGDIHIDVYDTASGNRVLAAKIPFGPEHLKPSSVFRAAMWVDGQYLVAPLDPYSRNCLLMKVPAN